MFSRKLLAKSLKEKIKLKANFFLFDANPDLLIKDFNYTKLAFSNEKSKEFLSKHIFYSLGSSLKTIHVDDKLWNFTRKLVTGNLKKHFKTFDVKTDTLDNYCEENNIEKIDILKIDTEGSELEVLGGGQNTCFKKLILF